MTPDFYKKWSNILTGVDKHAVPIEFIKKFVIRLEGRRQQTINIEKLLKQGLLHDDIADLISRKLMELDDITISVEFVLDMESIANVVQPEIDRLLIGIK